jgi:hypothetical protein
LRQAGEGIEATFANVERERRTGSSFDGTQALALLKGAYSHLESVSKLTPDSDLLIQATLVADSASDKVNPERGQSLWSRRRLNLMRIVDVMKRETRIRPIERARALYVADKHGWTRFVTTQDQLNLLYREEEREMLPLCRAEGIGFIPWSPLARGRLTRNWDETTERQENDEFGKMLFAKTVEADRLVTERVAVVAKARGVARAQVALAWVSQKPEVTTPIIGASSYSISMTWSRACR